MEKICAFYISDMHFITMILPFLKKELTSHSKIETFFEEDFKTSINVFLNSLILSENSKKEILKINWNCNKTRKYTTLETNLKNIVKERKQIIIIIGGSKEYIKEKNKLVEKFIKTKNLFNFKIVNCFKVSEFDDNICDILDSHEYILNTAGVHEIKDVFEDYKNKKA